MQHYAINYILHNVKTKAHKYVCCTHYNWHKLYELETNGTKEYGK